MTHQEKIKLENTWYLLAKDWKVGFVLVQFHQTWEIQKQIESEMRADGASLLQITKAIEPIRCKRNAFVRILKEQSIL